MMNNNYFNPYPQPAPRPHLLLGTMQPRHFPLPTLPFKSDFNGFGVGAKVQLNATPYASSLSGFEIGLLESGDDVAFLATISFDSQGRSAIDVRSRFAGKWSPTTRQIAVGLAIDRTFSFEISVDSSEFVVKVDGFKVTELVKRCDDVTCLVVTGSLIVNEIVMIPSLLYYTPPPEYGEVSEPSTDIMARLAKLALLPSAPEITPSNTLFERPPPEQQRNPPTHDKPPITFGGQSPRAPYEGEGIALSKQAFGTRFLPPRPPPPSVHKDSSSSASSNDSLPSKIPLDLPPTPAGCLRPRREEKPHDAGESSDLKSTGTNLYPILSNISNDSGHDNSNSSNEHSNGMAAKCRETVMNNNDAQSRHRRDRAPTAELHHDEGRFRNRRFSDYYASERVTGGAHRSDKDRVDLRRSSGAYKTTHSTPARGVQVRFDESPSNDPDVNMRSTSGAAQASKRSGLSHSASYENCQIPNDSSNQNQKPSKNKTRPRPQSFAVREKQSSTSVRLNHRSSIAFGVLFKPLFTTQQLQQKTEAVCIAAKNFFVKGKFKSSSFPSSSSSSSKQLIRTSLNQSQILIIIATPISGARKFQIGLMHASEYVIAFEARFVEKFIKLKSTRAGAWQEEERVHRFPFEWERAFTLKIQAANPLKIYVDGNFFCEYALRCGLPIDAIKIDENLRLLKFQVN